MRYEEKKEGELFGIPIILLLAGLGLLLWWMSTRKVTAAPTLPAGSQITPVAGVPMGLVYIPGVLMMSAFIMPTGTASYTTKSLLEEINMQAGKRVVSVVSVWRDGKWYSRTTFGGPDVPIYAGDVVTISVTEPGVVWIPTIA